AMVSNTSELFPEPDTPVNTVSRRFGRLTLTSLRLFSRAPCTRIVSWLSAGWRGAAARSGSVLVAMVIGPPSRWAAGAGPAWAAPGRRASQDDPAGRDGSCPAEPVQRRVGLSRPPARPGPRPSPPPRA